MRNQKSQLHDKASKDFAVAKKLRRAEEHKKQHDRALVEFFQGYIDNLLCDAHNSLGWLYGSADFTRDRQYVSRRLKNEGVSFIVDVLPQFMSSLLNLLENGENTFSPYYNTKMGGRPSWLRRLTEIAMNEVNYATETQAKAMEFIYNISVCGKKYRAQPDETVALGQWASFVAVDEEIGKIDLSSSDLDDILKSIQTQWFNFAAGIDLNDPACVPRPGPGSTVNVPKKSMRYAPHVLFQTLDSVFPYSEWFFPSGIRNREDAKTIRRLKKAERLAPYSEYLLVPKTYRKWRGICKEFNEVQFLQQALRRLLTKAIESFLGEHLPLSDQGVHATYALEASRTRSKATIDESEASDRILRSLVDIMTKLTPLLNRALMAVSTKLVVWKSQELGACALSTNKFAPMGSAVCFPIMSIVHLFLIKAIILAKGEDMTYAEKRDFCKQISVYGDDLVVPSPVVPLVYKWLPRFGMKINQTKSFVKSHFRESCGCHAYKGCDITPVYIKYTTFSSKEQMAKKCLSLLAVESQLFKRNMLNTAGFVRSHVDATWPNLPYVSDVTPLVGYRRPPFHESLTDFTLKRKVKWNRFLQTPVFRLDTFLVEAEKGCIPNDSESYLRYHCLKPKRDVSIRLGRNGLTSFRMDEFVKRLDDKTLRLYKARVPHLLSALVGHPSENLRVQGTK